MFHLVFFSTDEDEDVDANLNKQLDALVNIFISQYKQYSIFKNFDCH
jgi:hypothetical protein